MTYNHATVLHAKYDFKMTKTKMPMKELIYKLEALKKVTDSSLKYVKQKTSNQYGFTYAPKIHLPANKIFGREYYYNLNMNKQLNDKEHILAMNIIKSTSTIWTP